MNVYVASSTKNIPTVRRIQHTALAYGHRITSDWTKAVERYGENPGVDTLDKAIAKECALEDARGVRGADLVIVLCHPDMRGTWIEIGMALAWQIPVWLVGEPERDSVFFQIDEIITPMNIYEAVGKLGELSPINLTWNIDTKNIIPSPGD